VGHGTGLGLAIAHTIVTSLGGEISCSTKLGKGTTFRVVLAAAPEAALSTRPQRPAPAAGPGSKVRVVDDEPSVLRAISRSLTSDHDVVAVGSAVDALRLLTEENVAFDVIFCDLMMPVMTGMDLYRRVQAHDPAMAERFVFVTGGSANEELRRFLDEVPNERLEKPFGNESLQTMARRFARK
ncbi:MAG TPA: response regulator, partial [Labilithrix sp.]|nr:response regulator [Labilithrix sp.]